MEVEINDYTQKILRKSWQFIAGFFDILFIFTYTTKKEKTT